MHIKIRFITAVIFFLLTAVTASISSAEVYTHEKTGIIFPHKVAEHEIKSTDIFDEKGLGESVSFGYEKATGTVYIYNYNLNDIKDNSEHSPIMQELSNAVMVLKNLEEQKVYADLNISKEGRVFGNNSSFVLISVPVTYNDIKSTDTGEKISSLAVDSMISVGIYRNHFIKIRYSIPHNEQDDLKKSYEQRDAFIEDIRKIILEVEIRENMKKVISAYQKDPYSEKGRSLFNFIANYAKMSRVIDIIIDSDLITLLNIKEYPYWKDLMNSYIAGQTIYQITNNHFENSHEAGMEQLIRDYKHLKNNNEKAVLESIEELLKKEHAI